jgi:hypothetical protein
VEMDVYEGEVPPVCLASPFAHFEGVPSGGGEGRVVWSPRAAESKGHQNGRKMIIHEKFDFFAQQVLSY